MRTATSRPSPARSKAPTSFSLRTLEDDVRRSTAFVGAAALFDACERGYVPTIRLSADDSDEEAARKQRVHAWVLHAGFRVFEG